MTEVFNQRSGSKHVLQQRRGGGLQRSDPARGHTANWRARVCGCLCVCVSVSVYELITSLITDATVDINKDHFFVITHK